MSKQLHIFTDGGCIRNPGGPGGWGFAVFEGQRGRGEPLHKDCGGYMCTTNNRMELKAIIRALGWVARNCSKGDSVLIRTDSMLCINSLTNWAPGWIRRGWTKKDGTPVKNAEMLAEAMQELDHVRNEKLVVVNFLHVPGHSGNHGNEMADQLATRGRIAAQQRHEQAEQALA